MDDVKGVAEKVNAFIPENEAIHLTIALVVTAFIFAYPKFETFFYYVIAVVLVFLLHELMHRWVAKRFGAGAFFRIWPMGILLALMFAIAFNGAIKFVAVGAVTIMPFKFGRWPYKAFKSKLKHLTDTELGMIAFSGIGVNIFLAMLFGSVLQPLDQLFINAVNPPIIPFINKPLGIGLLNAFLALFNLIPIPPLDGSKVFFWKPWFWFFSLFISILILI
jgi:Zn-dependent protease